MGANGGAIPVKGILTVKLSKQKVQSAIPEIHPEISMWTKEEKHHPQCQWEGNATL